MLDRETLDATIASQQARREPLVEAVALAVLEQRDTSQALAALEAHDRRLRELAIASDFLDAQGGA